VLKVAVPPLSVPVPSVVAPSSKVTVPVGNVPSAVVTVAVKVTAAPHSDGLADEATEVLLEAWFTNCASGAEVLLLKLVSPLYAAVMDCVPTASVEVVNLALPLIIVAVPSVEAPFLNVTVPLGGEVVPVGVTVAVKVTDWP